MPFELSPVSGEEDWKELVRVQFEALGEPRCGFRELFFPRDEETPEAREAAVKECTERQMSEPVPSNAHWIKVTETDSGKFLGAALWVIFDEDPYKGEPHSEVAEWYPEGEQRDMATELMDQVALPRRGYMPKAHVFLDMMFTLPEARRTGVGRMLMDWGINEADKRDYEVYLDATESGRKMYEKYGFIEGPLKEWSLAKFESTPTRKMFEDRCFPLIWWPMFRPVQGQFKPGDTKLPWQ